MWLKYGEPAFLDLPDGCPRDTIAAWIRVRPTNPTEPVPNISNLIFVDPSEAESFVTAKRAEEHAAGRWLIEYLLLKSGRNPNSFIIERDDFRRPRLIGPNAPSITITHSGGFAAAALGPKGADIGLDLEPVMTRPRNLLSMMSSGEEKMILESLFDNDEEIASSRTTDVWVAKEAVQKAIGLGMGLPPQSFEVEGQNVININIEGKKHTFNIHRWKTFLNGQLNTLAIAEKI
ncbi:MAG: hypothetical protein CMA77_03095 [Euryarchaeota archaeon]|nr:hypothetical protein [Euryarchaeota archaeon]